MAVNRTTTMAYNPLLRDQIFIKDPDAISPPDSIIVDRSEKVYAKYLLDSVPTLSTRQKQKVYSNARQSAISARNSFSFDESTSKEALNQLYRNKNEWHRKLALPVSIFIFFLVGAPLGAIIRKGGLGTPIVISVIFFVIYYSISMSGEKMAKEGTWSSLLGMWISSIVLFPLAVYLTNKATNDSALLDFDWYLGKYKVCKDWVVAKLPQRWQDKINKK